MDTAITALQGVVGGLSDLATLVIVVMGFVIFREPIAEKFFGSKKVEKTEESKEEVEEHIPKWAGRIIQYANHDMTNHMQQTITLLTELNKGQSEMNKNLDRHMIVEENFQENVKDFIRESKK